MTAGAVEILIVEDDPADVELTLRALAKNNLANHVHTVRDGAEALEYVFSGNPLPKVVLLDVKLPKINGLDVLRQLKADPRTHRLPVVMLTSSREGPDIAEAYRLGANSYIVKPVEFEAFVKAVSDLGLYWLLLNEPPSAG